MSSGFSYEIAKVEMNNSETHFLFAIFLFIQNDKIELKVNKLWTRSKVHWSIFSRTEINFCNFPTFKRIDNLLLTIVSMFMQFLVHVSKDCCCAVITARELQKCIKCFCIQQIFTIN